MKILWNEYAGLILAVAGAASVTGIAASLMMPEGSIYQVLTAFGRGIC